MSAIKITNTQKVLLLCVSCFFFLIKSVFAQTGVLVKYYDGNEQSYSVQTSGKIYFDNANLMIVISENATPLSIPISIIRRITFGYGTLPVTIVDFFAENKTAGVGLYWTTSTEVNALRFIVERSMDGTTYEPIGNVIALNISTGSTYSYFDATVKNGMNYYRLKQVDNNGSYTYSKVIPINRPSEVGLLISPNPANDYFKIITSISYLLAVKIYSMAGQLLLTGNYKPGEVIFIGKLASGMYLMSINGKPYKLIKQ